MNILRYLPFLELFFNFPPVIVRIGLLAACGENTQSSLLGDLFRKKRILCCLIFK